MGWESFDVVRFDFERGYAYNSLIIGPRGLG